MKKRDAILNTVAHREAFDGFFEAMHSAERREGWRSGETLRHFVDAAFLAIKGRTVVGDDFAANEAEFEKLVGTFQNRDATVTELSKMLAFVTIALQAEPVDFVGPTFEAVSASADLGQFFTPLSISLAMARMQIGDPRPILDAQPFITLHEPACGVGGMMLAANVVLREAGVDVARQAHWTMIDIDSRAIRAAYVQAALTDASADVFHGNSLSLQVWGAARTPAAIMFPKVKRRPDPVPVPVERRPEQLSLL